MRIPLAIASVAAISPSSNAPDTISGWDSNAFSGIMWVYVAAVAVLLTLFIWATIMLACEFIRGGHK